MFLTLALQKMSQIVTPRQRCRIETQPARVKRYRCNQQKSRRGSKRTFKPRQELSRFSGPDTIFSGSHAIHLKIF